MKHPIVLCAAPALAVLLGACASTAGQYPSLAVRDAERVSGTAIPVSGEPPAPLPPPSADLEEQLASLVFQARSAHDEFRARQAAASRAASAARRSTPGSEVWTDAQVALSALDAARSRTMISLGDLDRLYADERLLHPDEPSPSALAIDNARTTVETMVEEENAVVRQITETIG